METAMKKYPKPTSTSLRLDLEPDDEWKEALKENIREVLLAMAEDARQKVNAELAKGISEPEERSRLTTDYFATLKTIRQLGEEQFQITLERERQERRWASGEQLHPAWSEILMNEQKAILDSIEREKKNKAPATSLRSNPTQRPLPPFPSQLQPTPGVPPESSTVTHNVRARIPTPMGSWKVPSVPDLEKSFLDHSKSSPIFDESLFMPPTPTPTPAKLPNSTLRGSEPGMNARPIVQEFWKPSITREEDAQMSRTFMLARRNNTASSISSFKTPSLLSIAFTDPLEALSTGIDKERSRIYKESEMKRKEEEVKRREQEVNSREMMARQKEQDIKRRDEEVRRRVEEVQREEEELCRREEEIWRREEDLDRREAEMRRREDDRSQEEFWRRDEGIRRQRAEERKKQELW